MNIKLISTLLFMACTCYGYSQQLSDKIGTNPTIINPSAVVEMESTTKGFLPPRMNYWQRNAISSPDVGLMVYCTNCGSNGELQIFNGTTWTTVLGGASANPILTVNMTTNTSGVLQFMTHNLGADTSADPLVPSWKLNGAYFQFGKKTTDTNGDWYKSTLNNGANGFAAAPTGPLAADANSGVVSSWSQTTVGMKSWNVTETSPVKTGSDPCPTGFRIPTATEWQSIYFGTWANIGSSDVASPTNYTTGKLINNMLFLPFTGERSSSTGELFGRGNVGFYWSSTTHPNNVNVRPIRLVFAGQNVPSNEVPLSGYSVRCVKQ